MNETEFETRVATLLKEVFPTILPLDISQQRSFKIKFGHHNVIVDGVDPGNYAKRSIYDILIRYRAKPLALLELKKPGVKLTDDDVDQGVSYARLTDPITPLTIISNSSETRIINTYTKAIYDVSEVTTGAITELFNDAMRLAATDLQSSISLLLDSDQRIIFDLINSISIATFQSKIGSCRELDKPIIEDLRIDRIITDKSAVILAKETCIFLVGDRYCGKTNFLYQLFLSEKQKGNSLLYVDCNEPNYSIFQKLSNFLTKEVKHFVSEDKIRQWILMDLNQGSSNKLTIAFDHFQHSSPESMKSHVNEISEIFQDGSNQVILSSDYNNYTALSNIEGSENKTIYKTIFKRIRLKYFDQMEYRAINDLLFESHKSFIMPGGEYSGAYRNPRIWRWLAVDSSIERPDEDSLGLIKAVPTIDFLNLISKRLHANDQTLVDFKKLTDAYLETLMTSGLNRNLKLMAMNLPVLTEEAICKYLDAGSVKRLLNSSLLEKRLSLEHKWVYIPKIPELFSKFSIEPLKIRFLELFHEDFDHGYMRMISICEHLPYGEIIAAKIIADYCFAGEDTLVYEIFNKLQSDKPVHETLKGRSYLRMFLPDGGYRDFKTPEDEEQHTIYNNFPYMVLSHLIGYPFETSEDDPHATHKKCIILIGVERHQLRLPHIDTFYELQPPTILVDNAGDLIVGDVGITEPIVQSLQAVFMTQPEVILQMVEAIISKRKFALLHRIYIAAKFSHNLYQGDEPNPCHLAMKAYLKNIHKMIAHGVAPKDSTREDIRRLEKEIKKRKTYSGVIKDLI